jgi:nitroreductase
MGEKLIDNAAFVNALNWRYATKSYDKDKKISAEDMATLEAALLLAPSSYGIQPYKFIVIESPELREKLKPAAFGQGAITDASALVAIAYQKSLAPADIDKFIDRIVDVRGTERSTMTGYGDMMKGVAKKAVDEGYIETWNSRQAYIPLGFLLAAAAVLGIDATPMEGFDPKQFNEILGLTDYSVVVLAALGYRDEQSDRLASLPKVRKPAGEIIERR